MSVENKRAADSGEVAVKRQDTRDSKGIAHLKPEYIVSTVTSHAAPVQYNDEEQTSSDRQLDSGTNKKKNYNNNKKKKRGQNKDRDNRQVKEKNALCPKLIVSGNPEDCLFGETCRFNHDVEAYLKDKKPEIKVDTFKVCPVWETLGYCPMGYKCRFLSTHSTESKPTNVTVANKELNHIAFDKKSDLIKKRFPFEKSEEILEILDSFQQEQRDLKSNDNTEEATNTASTVDCPQVRHRNAEVDSKRERQKDLYNKYKDTRYWSNEKKSLDFKRKKILSPLTTVGNLPYRRLMVKYGCDVTYSEMALGVPLIQGTNSEWALPKCHSSEKEYGVQIACSKQWQAAKATEALVSHINNVNEVNLNSGCPIDLLYRQGSGSALLDNPARLIRCLNSMNYVSGDVPVTVKIRSGTKDGHAIADSLVKRLVWETDVAAITLHGRSRQQRYTKLADWDYVSLTAKSLRESELEFSQSEQFKDSHSRDKPIQFVGNGDVNNWEDWYRILDGDSNIDSIMVARGALIKPWIFEEIESQQYLDKTPVERVDILRDYSRFAMEHWGTDEYGISQCRRFFCEFMSFFHRYIPMGICERYPVKLNERPPNWIGRDDTETLLGSTDVSDWIKLSEVFFGPVDDSFVFTPKHKSNSYQQPSK
ncbi:hypothetical protein KAFR_0A05860 [Kazachstania africana CBS 2517]|uniref:tRNA-dihydrouridine(47) synthase [NAD(P)(+)] n=1 Tax=Kazachstania africana (strain ATCC 22294 / BCRC 22015 / CBS 2517 / CECT 1963 / NBRC 1671 / NRRL Y-8276) TaxID=1071382 RepID=H2ANS1_KAZAF|nr:hypothetical protein KAFR_0A05860 [Kazachstania africana CBS 2517]CCF56021.1 hypothetical protein KAFR_0A05860 [Kazachstania africana CBS 2517]